MHPIPRLLLVSILPTAAACAAAGSAPAGAPAARVEWHEHASEAGARRSRLYLPAGLDRTSPAPLVVLLHGCTQDPDDFARGTRFDALADSAGAILAYPEQTAAHHPQKCWTWYDPASPEPAIVAAVTREVMARHPVDPARVYLAGISAGAAMAINTVAAEPRLYAAVGTHSGVAYRAAGNVGEALGVMRSGPGDAAALADAARAVLGAADRRALPLIAFHGTADAVVSPRNGTTLVEQWAAAAGARGFVRQRETHGGLDVIRDVWGTLAELWSVAELGHAWSGGDPAGSYTDPRGPDAAREMLRFFLAHRLP
jgi:poly(hydroxyalkanoate) depolymerase family esterase